MPRVLNADDPLVATSVFGKQVEEFLTSDLGDFLLKQARLQEEAAVEELIEAAGTKTQVELLEIRARVWQARKFQEWLGRAVENGLQALEMLKEEE